MMNEVGLIGRWSPGIGDPTLAGWLTVVCYLVTAWQCHHVIRSQAALPTRLGIEEKRLWWLITWGLLLLGLNKQLDLQTALTESARMLAKHQGWYETRRSVQLGFLMIVGLLTLAASMLVITVARRAPLATRIALAGTIALMGFVFIRTLSFHHVDIFIQHPALGLRINWLLEIGGITIILAGARLRSRL